MLSKHLIQCYNNYMIQWQIQAAGISRVISLLSLILSSTTVARKVKYSGFPVFLVVRHGHEVVFCASIRKQKLVQEISGKNFLFSWLKETAIMTWFFPLSVLSADLMPRPMAAILSPYGKTTGLQRRPHCYHWTTKPVPGAIHLLISHHGRENKPYLLK